MWQCSSLTAVFLLIIAIIDSTSAGTNCTAADATRNCIDGMAIPIWRPFLDLSTGDRVGRGIIYFFIIAYFFLGVSIVADRFMASIEVITSMERTITVKRPGLEPIKVTVRIWNDTVSNLTLMALGRRFVVVVIVSCILFTCRFIGSRDIAIDYRGLLHAAYFPSSNVSFLGDGQRLRSWYRFVQFLLLRVHNYICIFTVEHFFAQKLLHIGKFCSNFRRSRPKHNRRIGSIQSIYDHRNLRVSCAFAASSSSETLGRVLCDRYLVRIRLSTNIAWSDCN
jgi:hypothetical protein